MENLYRIDFDETTTLAALTELEWLETNGLGGWASSTLCGANSRRYHGILVASLEPPGKRYVMLSRLDETVISEGAAYPLATRIYPGAVNPAGYQYLKAFEKELFPSFYFEIQTGKGVILLKKTVIAPYGHNGTILRYELLQAPAEISLSLEPFVAARDYHAMAQANNAINATPLTIEKGISFRPYDNLPEIKIIAPGAHFARDPTWYYRFEYWKERERGLDNLEDLFHYGNLTKRMAVGEIFHVVVTTEEAPLPAAEEMVKDERTRRLSLLKKLPVKDSFANALALAADQFIVQRGENSKTVIAGYHWFADWGRDTMISLPGLCLSTGRTEEAKEILQTFAEHVDEGMLPNRFLDDGEECEYNSVDAALWFFIAIYRYYQATHDVNFIKSIYKPLLSIISYYENGTRYGIKADADGLLATRDPSVQLTWMDAKIGDWVVTPRTGKAVEINALWYNALVITGKLAHILHDDKTTSLMDKKANLTAKSFQKAFWNEEKQCLYDVIDDQKQDGSIRPNQLIALALPFEILGTARAKKVLSVIEEKLFTPYGIRSLAPEEPNYAGHYSGDVPHRDGAYHQGTAWSWLLGSYLTALARYRGDKGILEAKKVIENFKPHLWDAGIGSISEIFDGDSPYRARGCIAQAWGVAEILRAYLEITPKKETKPQTKPQTKQAAGTAK